LNGETKIIGGTVGELTPLRTQRARASQQSVPQSAAIGGRKRQHWDDWEQRREFTVAPPTRWSVLNLLWLSGRLIGLSILLWGCYYYQFRWRHLSTKEPVKTTVLSDIPFRSVEYARRNLDEVINPTLEQLDRLARLRAEIGRKAESNLDQDSELADIARSLSDILEIARSRRVPDHYRSNQIDIVTAVTEAHRAVTALRESTRPSSRERQGEISTSQADAATRRLNLQKPLFEAWAVSALQ
jgi:hypothetical protein